LKRFGSVRNDVSYSASASWVSCHLQEHFREHFTDREIGFALPDLFSVSATDRRRVTASEVFAEA